MLHSIRSRLVAAFLCAWIVFTFTTSAIVWLAVGDIARNIVLADVNRASLRISRLAFQYAISGRPVPANFEAIARQQIGGLHVNMRVVPFVGASASLGALYEDRAGPPIGPHAEMQSVPFGTARIAIYPDFTYPATTSDEWLTGAIAIDLLLLIPAWFLARIVAQRTLEPLLNTTRALERFAGGDFSPHPVTTRGQTEIGDLARAYNAAVRQITSAFDERSAAIDEMRQFIADAGHQLRTPLTVFMGHVSVMRPTNEREETVFGNMLAQCRRMKAIIDNLIVLARLEHVQNTLRTVDVNHLAQGVVNTFRDGGYDRVELHPGAGAQAHVNPEEVVDAMTALVENALKYAPEGPVRVAIAREGERCTICVEDSGPGMTAIDLERAFDRFYRGESSAGTDGTGLGLSIVRRSVERSNGSVTLVNAASGLRVVLSFTLA